MDTVPPDFQQIYLDTNPQPAGKFRAKKPSIFCCSFRNIAKLPTPLSHGLQSRNFRRLDWCRDRQLVGE